MTAGLIPVPRPTTTQQLPPEILEFLESLQPSSIPQTPITLPTTPQPGLQSQLPSSPTTLPASLPTAGAAGAGAFAGKVVPAISEFAGSVAPIAAIGAGAKTAADFAQGEELNTAQKVGFALPTAGLSLFSDTIQDMFGIGGGKSEDQQRRDAARDTLAKLGIAQVNNGEHFVTLSDGSQASIGKDGGAKFTGFDGKTEFHNAFNVDTSHPLHGEASAFIDPLTEMLFGKDKDLQEKMSIQLVNAVLNNVGAEDQAKLEENVRGLYKAGGIKSADVLNAIPQMLQGGVIDEATATAFDANVRRLAQLPTGQPGQPGGQVQSPPQGGPVTRGSALWKPQSESDGNLVVLFPYAAGKVVIKDAKTGQVLDVGRSTGPSNGFADTVRFSRPGSAFRNVILEDSQGNSIPIEDGSQRIENIPVSGVGGLAATLAGVTPNVTGSDKGSRGRPGKRKGKRVVNLGQFDSPAPQRPAVSQPAPKTVGDFTATIRDMQRRNQGA